MYYSISDSQETRRQLMEIWGEWELTSPHQRSHKIESDRGVLSQRTQKHTHTPLM